MSERNQRGAALSSKSTLFGYIWHFSRPEQLVILAWVVASQPFYFWSLDLPKTIVNEGILGRSFQDLGATQPFMRLALTLPSWLGGAPIEVFSGIELQQLPFLMALSSLFLIMVLVNGAFKYVINIRKGVLGERMLRRLRFDLFDLLLRFRPEVVRGVKPSEAASVIKDEVEPIGGFIGDAYVQPAFLGGQILTALAFITIQNVWLGLLTISTVLAQAIIIPILRREQVRLGRERQIAARQLAGRIGEVVETVREVHIHGTDRYERAEIGDRLGRLFLIRLNLYRRKFAVKFLNNLISSLTPFLYYVVGGYFALSGRLDIGQLVAVISAYRDLPAPMRDLIAWDQQRQDATVKFEAIIQQMAPEDGFVARSDEETAPIGRADSLEATRLGITDVRGAPIVDGVSLSIPAGKHVALVGQPGDGHDVVAKALGRQVSRYSGVIRVGGRDLAALPSRTTGSGLVYLGPDPVLVPGSIRDNLLFGLRFRPLRDGAPLAADAARSWRLHPKAAGWKDEARKSGNPLDDVNFDWIDYGAAGVNGPEDLDDWIEQLLGLLELTETIYSFGLGGRIDPERAPELAARFLDARRGVREVLDSPQYTGLIEPFDPDGFVRNATLRENLLFGVPVGSMLDRANFMAHPFVRDVLERKALAAQLVAVGVHIAETMVEIFAGLPPDHPLFDRFSFISSDDLPGFAEVLARKRLRPNELPQQDRLRLMGLALDYIEPRHRLGLMTRELMDEVLAARRAFIRQLPEPLVGSIEFYDPMRYCAAATVRDNLLFGRISQQRGNADEVVNRVMRDVVKSLGVDRALFRVGLDHQVGPNGRLLFPSQRAAVTIARGLVKRPAILILDDAFSIYSDDDGARLLARLREARSGFTTVVAGRESKLHANFDMVIGFSGGRLVTPSSQGSALESADEPATA